MQVARLASAFAVMLIIFFLGCHHAATAYVLQRNGLDPIVFPPTRSDNALQIVSVAIKGARKSSAKTDCDIPGDVISLRWRGKTADISFRSQAFFATSSDQSPNQIGRGMLLDPLFAIDKFRLALSERQAKGCLREIENERLRRTIVEYFPLPPAIAYVLQMGSYDMTGYFDLTPDFRMQITIPIYPPRTEPSTKPYWDMRLPTTLSFAKDLTTGRDSDWRLTEVLIGAAPIEKWTLRNELPFSDSPSHFRLLFMAEETASGRISRAVLLSAPEETKLMQAVARRGNRPDDFCTTLSITDVKCTILPKNFGVSPELRVRVNQKDAFVSVGGMVQDSPISRLPSPDRL